MAKTSDVVELKSGYANLVDPEIADFHENYAKLDSEKAKLLKNIRRDGLYLVAVCGYHPGRHFEDVLVKPGRLGPSRREVAGASSLTVRASKTPWRKHCANWVGRRTFSISSPIRPPVILPRPAHPMTRQKNLLDPNER